MATTKREAYERIAELHNELSKHTLEYYQAIKPINAEIGELKVRFEIQATDTWDLTADAVQATDDNWESSWEESSC